jgi:hypothetical protein
VEQPGDVAQVQALVPELHGVLQVQGSSSENISTLAMIGTVDSRTGVGSQ